MAPIITCIAKIEHTAAILDGPDGEVAGEIIIDLHEAVFIGLKAGQLVGRLVLESLAILDLKIVLKEVGSPLCHVTGALFVCEEPL